MQKELSRRDYLKLSGLALGGLAATGATRRYGGGSPHADVGNCYPTHFDTQKFTYYEQLPPFDPRTPLEPDEMRISFMGSAVPPYGRAQRMMSVFVEVGWVQDDYLARRNPPQVGYRAQDQFVFDCGSGVVANYNAMNVGFARMDKVFLTHLHGDHISDLTSIYAFGPSTDRKSPLFVWGPGPSGLTNPGNSPAVQGYSPTYPYPETPAFYDDGTRAFCTYFREANRWQTEAFAFQSTRYASYEPPTRESWGLPHDPVPVGDDPIDDGFALVPIELEWQRTGLDAEGKPTGDNIAYENKKTNVKITHFPVIHCRQGSVGYKLEWTPPGAVRPLSMIFTGDTKPEWNSVNHAINKDGNGDPRGVDVFIHEMGVAPDIWAMKVAGYSAPPPAGTPGWQQTVDGAITVQNSSHTPQGAFGYLLSRVNPRPRLTVATHFPTTDDTVACALRSVQAHCPEIRNVGDKLTWSYDCMVIRVFPNRIEQRRSAVSDHTYSPYPAYARYDILPPKYHYDTGGSNPYYQIDRTYEILSTEEGGFQGDPTYRKDGY